MVKSLEIPKELLNFKELIESTVKNSVVILPDVRKTSLTESKFCGDPYFPNQMTYPKDENGEPMKLLAQINFSELPQLNEFPTSGLLQFYISADDDVYGIDFDEPAKQKNFKLIYHEQLNETDLIEDFSFVTNDREIEFPIGKEAGMTFDLVVQPVSAFSVDFDIIEENIPLDQKIEHENCNDLHELYIEKFVGEGHRIGGYPYFTQADPREKEEHPILLLQIDSDDSIDCMFGDVGVANFFISREDLLNRNFTNVLYNWDCC